MPDLPFDSLVPVTAFVAVIAAVMSITIRMRRDVRAVKLPTLTRSAVGRHDSLLDRAAAGFESDGSTDTLVAEAARALVGLDGISACRYEQFPFETRLPRVANGRIVVAPEEPGGGSLRTWTPGDGAELPVYIAGLQVGRFVVLGEAIAGAARIPTAVQVHMVAIADRLNAALTHGWRSYPNPELPRGDTWLTSSSS